MNRYIVNFHEKIMPMLENHLNPSLNWSISTRLQSPDTIIVVAACFSGSLIADLEKQGFVCELYSYLGCDDFINYVELWVSNGIACYD